jgi:uncharacterized phage infection (PIP) family protein YhgE
LLLADICALQGIGATLKTYAERVQAVAASIPNQPPLADITNNLQSRSQQLAESSNQLLPAVADALAAPTNVLRAGISDLNNGLTALLQDLDSQARRAPELARLLADGPLARVANDLNNTVGSVAREVAVSSACSGRGRGAQGHRPLVTHALTSFKFYPGAAERLG